MVSSEGAKDDALEEDEVVRDLVRRNHSSGIQMRKARCAFAENGFSQNECSSICEVIASGGTRREPSGCQLSVWACKRLRH